MHAATPVSSCPRLGMRLCISKISDVGIKGHAPFTLSLLGCPLRCVLGRSFHCSLSGEALKEGTSTYLSLNGPLAQVFKDKDRLPRRVKFQWVEGDPASVDALAKAQLSQAQALIIGGSSTAQPKEADAFTLTTITLAQVSAPPWLACPDHHNLIRPVHSPMRPLISSQATWRHQGESRWPVSGRQRGRHRYHAYACAVPLEALLCFSTWVHLRFGLGKGHPHHEASFSLAAHCY